MALPFLPMTLACGSTDVSSKVVQIAAQESLYSPLAIQVTLQLTDKDPKKYLDEFFKLTLLEKTNVAEHKRHFMLHGETEYIAKVTQERREWKRTVNGERVIQSHLLLESPLALLRNGHARQIFYDKKVDEVFKTVLDGHSGHFSGKLSVTKNLSKLPKTKQEYLVQYGETDLDFLMRLCQEHGIGFTQIGKDLVFAGGDKLTQGSKRELEYDGFSSWERVDVQLGRTIDARNLKPGEAWSKITKSTKSVGKPKDAVYQAETFHDEKAGAGGADEYLQIFTESLAHQEHGYVLRSTYDWEKESGVFAPTVGLRVGELVPGPPKEAENDTFLIEEVRWSFARSGKEQAYDFTAVVRSTETPYAPPRRLPRPQEHSLLRAQVIGPRAAANVDSDGKLGRIKVLFLWDKEDESARSSRTCWVRLMTPYAGKKHGFYLMPEVGDEVLVAFEGGDLHRPIAIGYVHDRESAIIKELTGSAALQLETLAFNTPKGIKARIWEKEGSGKPQQTIKVELTDQIKLGLLSESEVDVNLHSEGTAQVHALKTITIKSDEKIELLCGDSKMTMLKDGTITIEGKDITVKGTNITNTATADIKTSGNAITETAKADFKMSGANIKSNADANLEAKAGANVTIKAGAAAKMSGVNAEVSGSAAAKLKGVTVDVSGSAMTKIAGGLVKIN